MGHFIRAECYRVSYEVSVVCSIDDSEQALVGVSHSKILIKA